MQRKKYTLKIIFLWYQVDEHTTTYQSISYSEFSISNLEVVGTYKILS